MKKKLISSLLMATLLMAPLAGCSQSVDTSKETSTPSGSQVSTNSAGTESKNSNFNETGYPIVNEKINLKVLLNVRDTDTLVEINEMPGIKKLEEMTNIHVEWEVVKGSDWNTKLNLIFASGDYPDVILSANSPVDYEEYGVSQKLLLPVDDLVDQYMPIYKERAEAEPEDVLLGLRASDEKMYSVGTIMAQNVNTPSHYFINQTWLDALELETPTTVEELTDVLRAFKTGDPNGNGIADEIPYELMLEDSTSGIKLVFPMFGIPGTVGGNYLYLDNDKQVQFMPYQEGFRDALEWLNLLYTEGLVDVEMISQDTTMVETKLAEGNVGFFNAWRLTQMGEFSEWAEANVVLMDPVAAEGYEVKMLKTMELAKRGAYITVTNEHVPETMRWLDAQLETEMMFTLFTGEEGKGWIYNKEGLIETLDANMQNAAWDALNVNGLFFAPGEYYYDVYQMASHRVEKTEYCKEYTEKGYLQEYSNDLLRIAPRTAEEIERCSILETDINNAIKEYMAIFITQGITDQQWDTFISMFDKMGVEEYIKIYQESLDNSGL